LELINLEQPITLIQKTRLLSRFLSGIITSEFLVVSCFARPRTTESLVQSASLFGIVFLFSGLITTLASTAYLDRENLQYPEYYVLTLFATVGMMLMASSLDLIAIFISLEIMSLAVYVLVGFRRVDRRSNEAALKYFILGSVASAVLLYGTALLYGATQTTNLREIFLRLHERPELMTSVFALGACLLVAGFLFKVAAFPFHMWMPDVYEGAPTPVTGFMTTGLKAAAFAVFARALALIGYGDGLSDFLQTKLHDLLWVCALATMLVGNLAALKQTNLKRMLAYSSIAHTGYILVGFIAARGTGAAGFAPVVLYMIAYTIMNLGAFAVLSAISSKNDAGVNLHDLSGLSQTRPAMAFALTVFLFSMAGVPPTAGFVAKYLLFSGAVRGGEVVLVVLAVLTSAVAAYYYLRAMVFMYMKDPITLASTDPRGFFAMPGAVIAIVLTVILTIQF
ncbi:MAG: NADH-quinone oxidoreductase subunit N, partial [Bdellovibrionota bacterium]